MREVQPMPKKQRLSVLAIAALCLLLTVGATVNAQDAHPVITPENASQLTELALLARGQIRDVDWMTTRSGDEQLVVAAGGVVWIYNANDLSAPPIDQIEGFDEPVNIVSVRPDGEQLAIGEENGSIILRERLTGFSISLLEHTDWISDLNFSPDGTKLASASRDGTVRVWNTENGALLYTLTENTPHALTAVFSPDGKLLATGGGDANELGKRPSNDQPNNGRKLFGQPVPILIRQIPVLLWDAETGEAVDTLYGPNYATSDLVFSADGKLLAAETIDYEVHIWNLETDEEIAVSDRKAYPVSINNVMSFAPDNSALFYSTANSTNIDRLYLKWDFLADEYQITDIPVSQQPITAAFYNPDYSKLVIASTNDIAVYDAATYQPLDTMQANHHDYLGGFPVFSPDGDRLAMFDNNTSQITIWDTTTQQELFRLSGPSYATVMAFNSDGARLAVNDTDGTIYIWDMQTQTEIMQLHGHEGIPTRFTFSPDGQWLASSGSLSPVGYYPDYDGTVRIWSLNDQSNFILETNLTSDGYYTISGLTFSPDSQVLAVRDSYLHSRFYDVVSHRELSQREWQHLSIGLPFDTLATPDVEAFQREIYLGELGNRFHADGTLSEGTLAILWPEHVARTVSGYLSLSDFDNTDSITITNMSLNLGETTLTGLNGDVYQKVFSPDGQLVITASGTAMGRTYDGTLRLWNTLTGEQLWIGDLSPTLASIYKLVISPDGRYILTGMDDSTIRLWGIDTESGTE